MKGRRLRRPGGTEYEYDLHDNLVGYRYDTPKRLTEYNYDSPSRLTSHTYVIPVRLLPTSRRPDTTYVFGSYIDEVLCMVKADNSRYFYSTNDLYSAYALTDAAGNVVERYQYDPFGKTTIFALDGTTVRTASLYGNPWTFTGRRLDGETGLMYYRNRMYSTELGRFVSRDPIGYKGGDFCMYGMTKGNPVWAVDPSGLRKTIDYAMNELKTSISDPVYIDCKHGKVSITASIDASVESVLPSAGSDQPGRLGLSVAFTWIPKDACCQSYGWKQDVWDSSGWRTDDGKGGKSGAIWYEDPVPYPAANALVDAPGIWLPAEMANGKGDDFISRAVCDAPATRKGSVMAIIKWGYRILASGELQLKPPKPYKAFGGITTVSIPPGITDKVDYTIVRFYLDAECGSGNLR